MTERASLGAPSVSGVSMKSDGKSPTLCSMSTTTGTELLSPPPYQPFPQRRESQELRQLSSSRRVILIPSRTLERRGSGPHPPYSPPEDRNPLTSPLAHSYIPSSSSSPSATRVHGSDEEHGRFGLSPMHPPMSYWSTSTFLDSVVTTPAHAGTAQTWPLNEEVFFPNWILRRSESTSGHPRRLPQAHPKSQLIRLPPTSSTLASSSSRYLPSTNDSSQRVNTTYTR